MSKAHVLFAAIGKFLKKIYAYLSLKLTIFVLFYPWIQLEKFGSPLFLWKFSLSFGFPHPKSFSVSLPFEIFKIWVPLFLKEGGTHYTQEMALRGKTEKT